MVLKRNDTVVFGKWEAMMIMLNLTTTHILLNFPRNMVEAGGTAGWMISVYATVIVLLLFYIITKLYEKFEGKDILDISEYMGGNIARIIVGSFLSVYILFIISTILREFAEDMKVISLTVSPISFVILLFVLGVVVGAYAGIEAIVRFAAIVVPIIVLGFLFIIIAVAPYYDITNLFPILGSGVSDIFVKGALKISIFSGFIVIFFLPPFIKTHKNFKMVGYSAILLSGYFFVSGVLAYLLTIPYPTALENFLPVYQMARMINYGRFFQRIESVFVIIWSSGAFIYLSFGLFLVVYTFKKAFKLEYYKPLVLPFAILLFTLSLIPLNLMETIKLETEYIRNAVPFIVFVLPIIILAVANIKRRKEKKERAACEK